MAELLNAKSETRITSIIIKTETVFSGTTADGSEIKSVTPNQTEISASEIDAKLLTGLNAIAGVEE